MWIITHTLSPVVVIAAGEALAIEKTKKRIFEARHYVLFAASGALPDVLYPHLSLADRYSSWTHTLWFLLGFIPLAILAGRFLVVRRRALTIVLMIFSCAFHLFCDAIAGGIAWLYPVSNAIIGRYFVPSGWWFTLDIISLASAAILLLWVSLRARWIGGRF